ncbi:OmpA family protein [Paraflavitalea sp. CAU 1676]|uniref:OmpA family protein n=1 Tax=Paraflavitalea sp. CAU 1676 TaxID=3032598 RepID=UPI0023D9BC85|nr:OmpA family protein [Paraflavitalea sp. CAU 1676]MDF2192171.1 OmpA family protein [Paraflavitalea sp. CAU 1676]
MKKVLVCLAVCLLLAAKGILAQEVAREWDNRWFISPLCKFQVQEFGMLEKNKLGFLSNANELPIMDKINASFAASAYKNIAGRLSFSVDVGLAYGHVASKDRMIGTTEKQTYNLLNATLYYHLLSHRYRLQPFISAGINNLINDSSYTSVPMGVGLKFTSKKIMVLGQAAYGYSVSKNISNTIMYSVGMYLAINNKKKKKSDKDKAASEQAALDSMKKAQDSLLAKKSDTTKTNGQSIVNNFYINVNVDSLLNARAGNANGNNNGNSNNPNGNNANGDQDGFANGNQNGSPNGNNSKNWGKDRQNGQSDFGDSIAGGKTPQAFDLIDFQVDTINGKPALKFIIYFYYKDYSLTSRAFATVDKVIAQLKRDPKKVVEVKGYTDNVGSTEYNNYLSMRRAQMAFDYMNSRGVPAERMIVSYYGKEYPVAENTQANAWLNRRVELIVHDKE